MKTHKPTIRNTSRRHFLKSSAALVVGFGATGLVAKFGLSPAASAAQGINGNPGNQLDSWIAIGVDGKVTAYTGKCELGHGLHTAQTQLIAEELCVPLNRVTLLQCDTNLTPDQGTTSGAQLIPQISIRPISPWPEPQRESANPARLDSVNIPADQLGCP